MSFQPAVKIKDIIKDIDRNKLLLPSIQREFVWEHTSIELLFDSLMRGYPIGSLLFWDVTGENCTRHRFYKILTQFREKFKVHCENFNTLNHGDFKAVLDGQQRLTALYIGLKGSYAYKIKNLHWIDNEDSIPTRYLYLNLTESCPQDELTDIVNEDGRFFDFRFLKKNEVEDENIEWFKVSDIFNISDIKALFRHLGSESSDYKVDTLTRLFEIVHTEELINYYLEKDDDYEKALNIFIRMNSGGVKLDYSDLIMSTTIACWDKLDAKKVILELVDSIWNNYKFKIEKDIILRSYLMLYSENIKFRVTNFNDKNAKEFQTHWDEIRKCINETFKLISSFGYNDTNLTAKNAVLPIILYLYKTKKYKKFTTTKKYSEERQLIRKWLNTVLLHRIFGGQSESILKTIKVTIEKQLLISSDKFPAKQIGETLVGTRKSITVSDEFMDSLLKTKKNDRYSFLILSLLYPHLNIKVNNFHIDHLHPIDSFKPNNLNSAGIPNVVGNEDYYNKEIFDGIINLQLLIGDENQSKGKMKLTEWVKKNNPDLEKTFIDDLSLEFSDFSSFIEGRKVKLKKALKKAMTF